MVARPGPYQFSCNSGELAPELAGNTGLKQYYAGLATALNIEPVPQGGFDLAPRSRYHASLPRTLDAAGRPAIKLLSFSVSRSESYVVALTPGQIDIFKAGVHCATLAAPYAVADIARVKFVQRVETMFLFHASYPTQRLLRHGNDATWTLGDAPFTNIPLVDYGGAYTDTIEQWDVYIQWTSGSSTTGVQFLLSVDGEETYPLLLASGTLEADMVAALEALPNVDPGIAVTLVGSNPQAVAYEVDFSGGTNSGANFSLTGRMIANNNFSLQTWRHQRGVKGGEAVFSPARGYAACGRFYQDRLVLGGFAAKTSAFGLSRTGEYFDLNIKIQNAAGGLLLNLDTDGDEGIVEIAQDKHLVLFTSEADYYVSDRAISAIAPPNSVRSGKFGCSYRVPVVEQESGLLYVNRNESMVMAATFDAVSESYVSSPISLLASHIVSGLGDAALQKSNVATNADRYFLVRDDGLMVTGLLIRNQDVIAFVRWQTEGQVRAVAVDGAGLVHIAVERLVGGVSQLFLETLEEGLLLDGAVDFAFANPATALTGLTMHEGAIVWAIADGYVEGPFTVAGGAVTLPNASRQITIGRWTAPIAKTLPLVRDVAPHTVLKRPARVHTVRLDLLNTTSLAIGANGRPAKDVPLYRAGQATDQPLASYSGERAVTGLKGFTQEGQVVITQVRPGALQVRDITTEART
jgi:hypothetical protein